MAEADDEGNGDAVEAKDEDFPRFRWMPQS